MNDPSEFCDSSPAMPVLTLDQMARLYELIESPPDPSPALIDLMRGAS